MPQQHSEPVRSLEEISHLFLSGSFERKPLGAEAGQKGVTTAKAPSRSLPRFAPPELLDQPPSTSLTRNSFFLCSSEHLRPVRTFITALLARELAHRGFRVAAVETAHDSPNLMSLLPDARQSTGQGDATGPCVDGISDTWGLQGGNRDLAGQTRPGITGALALGFWNSGQGLGDTLNMFTSLYRDADIILVNSTPDVTGIESFVWLLNPFYIVLTSPGRNGLLRAYQSLKRISGAGSSERLGLLVAEEPGTDTAEPGFRVVSTMVQRFLSRELVFIGRLPRRLAPPLASGAGWMGGEMPVDPEISGHIVRLADTLVTCSGALK